MKTNLDQFYKTNKTLETEGIWFDVSEEIGFRMKRFGGYNSPSIKAATAKHYKPYARMVQNGTLPQEKEREISVRTFVEAVVTDWKGIKSENGEEVEFNHDNCVDVLIGLPDLTETLIQYSSDFNNFKEELGNS